VQGVRQPRTPGCCCLLALNTADCCSNPFVFDPNNEDANPGSGALAAATEEVRTPKTRMGRRRGRAQFIALI